MGGAGGAMRCRGGYCDGSLPLYFGREAASWQHVAVGASEGGWSGVQVGAATATVPRELLLLDMELRGSDKPAYLRHSFLPPSLLSDSLCAAGCHEGAVTAECCCDCWRCG